MLGIDGLGNLTGTPGREWELDRLFASIAHLTRFYPGFELWFWSKVVPGLGQGSLRIFQMYVGKSLAAISILKRVPGEHKICTLWVAPFARRLGLGTHVLRNSLTWLECDKPLITVCEERFHELQPLLRKFGFTLEEISNSHYRPGRSEYAFNGLMSHSQVSCQKIDCTALHLNERATGTLCLPSGRSDF